MNKDMISWFEILMPFLTGEKKWNTGCLWVCESHPLMPYEMGYSFDCDCGAPGMSPYIHQVPEIVIERFVKQCEKSIEPDLFTKLVEEIIPALKLAVMKPETPTKPKPKMNRIKTIDDAIDQFIEDLSYEVLKIWAHSLAVEINEPPTSEMWPDWENELRVAVGEAMLRALN